TPVYLNIQRNSTTGLGRVGALSDPDALDAGSFRSSIHPGPLGHCMSNVLEMDDQLEWIDRAGLEMGQGPIKLSRLFVLGVNQQCSKADFLRNLQRYPKRVDDQRPTKTLTLLGKVDTQASQDQHTDVSVPTATL